ncbi:L-2,4-diaminobutyrate decarboxylase [bacterium BMS3Abin02]|nr:L-2,4-diaminobutyrate decarboxylase [bacterium BMS3Abin02]HDL50282.1 aspartate aminotransferase family protein [Actinomycetota bacterium]
MDDTSRLLRQTAELAGRYLSTLDQRPVFPHVQADDLRTLLAMPLPGDGVDAGRVIEELAAAAEPGLVAGTGGRYFGFVTGGSVPAALAADWLATAWDQNAFSYLSSPAAAIVEEVAAIWVKDLLLLPADASVGFVTGCQMAHVTCLAAARHEVLRRVGWNVSEHGLGGAPHIRVVAGRHRHMTVDRALRLLGIGEAAIEQVETDAQGRILPDALDETLTAGTGPVIVVAQAGEVNTGAFDPLSAVTGIATEHGAWTHVDGAFGIWARASTTLQHLTDGLELADSWAFDAHKWLNVPYDSGVAVCAHPEAHRAAMLGEAAYLLPSATERDAIDWTPDASRRARGFAVYAALRSLGRNGVADLVDRSCAHARRLADGISRLSGATILNDVVLNQVLVRFGDDNTTERILGHVQGGGVAWMGGTTWNGRSAIRISVSSWATNEMDVNRTIAEFADAAHAAT